MRSSIKQGKIILEQEKPASHLANIQLRKRIQLRRAQFRLLRIHDRELQVAGLYLINQLPTEPDIFNTIKRKDGMSAVKHSTEALVLIHIQCPRGA